MYSPSNLRRIMQELHRQRSHEADFVEPGRFIDGYTMALEDIWSRLFDRELGLERDIKTGAPVERPF